jgi:DNA polymerase (family 10)
VLQGIAMSRQPQGRHLHRGAAAMAYAVNEVARTHPDWMDVTPSGDFRRGCELIRDLSLVAIDPKHRGDTKTDKHGELMVHLAAPMRYGIALLLATGSAEHVAALTKLAHKKGMTLDESGLRKKGRVVALATEEDIYESLGLPFIPPELRETGDEVQRALKGKLPQLVTRDELRGVLHAHTTRARLCLSRPHRSFSNRALCRRTQGRRSASAAKRDRSPQ